MDSVERGTKVRGWRSTVLLVSLVASLAAGCTKNSTSGSSAAGSGVIKIGVDTAQTGGLAPFDQPALKGLQMAVDEINANGGIDGKWQIDLTIKDMQSDSAQAAVVARDLLSQDIGILITPCDQDPSIGAGRLAQAQQVPAISFCASTPTLEASVGDYMFTNFPGDNAEATVSANYAVEQGYKTAYILVSPDTAYTAKLPVYFQQVFEAKGGQVLGTGTYTLDQQDFSAEVTKIQNMNPSPDLIMTSMYEPLFPAFLKQLRAAGLDTPVIGSDGIDTPTITKLGAVADGVVYTTAGFPAPGSPLEKFNADYEQKYGSPPDTVFAGIGYDLGKIIEAAVTAAGSTDPVAIRDALANLQDVQGVTSTITYAGTNGLPIREVALVEIKDGEKTLIAMVKPDASEIPAP